MEGFGKEIFGENDRVFDVMGCIVFVKKLCLSFSFRVCECGFIWNRVFADGIKLR